MKTFRQDFDDRVSEFNEFFEFVKFIDAIETHKKKSLKISDNSYLPQRDLQKILRSNCFLMLYNIIEASIRNGILAIYDSIHDDGLKYDDLSERIKEIWVTYKSKQIQIQEKKVKTSVRELMDEVSTGYKIYLGKETIQISGNLDYDNILKIINTYGFFGRITGNKTSIKKSIDKVKTERNLLAHGNKTFCQSGEIVTITDLSVIKDDIISFLKEILDNIECYIQNTRYKK